MEEPDLTGNDELVECVFILFKHYGGCETTECKTVQSERAGTCANLSLLYTQQTVSNSSHRNTTEI